MFRQEFSMGENTELEVLSRREICQKFQVEDGEDNIKVINDIIKNLPKQETIIYFDETPLASIEGNRPSYDWTGLKLERSDVSIIISLQPIRQHTTLKSKAYDIKCPEDADFVELNTQYRSTENILNFNCTLYEGGVPVEYNNVKSQPSDTISGPEAVIINVKEPMNIMALRTWIHHQLWKIRCTGNDLKIIHTEETEKAANDIFDRSEFQQCMTTLIQFQGCESSIVVLFFSKIKKDMNNFSKLIDMSSRARYKGLLKYYMCRSI